jgi:hypothetical protein
MKYIKDDEHRRIDVSVKPFEVHEVRFGDAKYFMNPEERSKTPVVQTSNAAKMKSFISKEAVVKPRWYSIS